MSTIKKLQPFNLDNNASFTFGNVTANGNVIANGNISTTNANLGNAATANFFIGSGNNLSNIQGANVSGQVANALVAGTVYTAAQPNITSVGTLTSLATSGDVTVGGNLTVNGTTTTINATTLNVADLNITLANGAASAAAANGAGISVNGASATMLYLSGTDTWNFNKTLVGDLTGLASSATIAASANAVAGANVSGQVANSLVAGTVYTNAQPNITSVGTLTGLAVTGNITAGNANLGNLVTANFFSGNGSLLTGLPAGYTDSNVATYMSTYSGNLALSGANISLGSVSNLHITGGTANYVLKTDGVGNLSWTAQTGGGGGTSLTYTANTAPPVSGNVAGDQWYNTSTNVLYEYLNDGTTSYWIDVQTPTVGAATTTTYVNRSYTGDGTTTTYTVTSGCSVNNILVFINGICQMPTTDYTVSNSTLTLIPAAAAAAVIQIRELPR